MNITDTKLSRRVILQGAGAVALVGLGNLPFGRNRILTEQEISAIVDFLQTL